VKLPSIDWNDEKLVTTSAGQLRLRHELELEEKRSGHQYLAIAQNGSTVTRLHWGDGQALLTMAQTSADPNDYYRAGLLQTRVDLGRRLMDSLSVNVQNRQSFFQVVSQVSPSGGASLEDLTFLDFTDPEQWALLVMRVEDNDFHVFRKLYVVKSSP
jgi:hypothetical protein